MDLEQVVRGSPKCQDVAGASCALETPRIFEQPDVIPTVFDSKNMVTLSVYVFTSCYPNSEVNE